MDTLSFRERRFLETYRRFYGVPYPAGVDDGKNHRVQGQMATYLLSLAGAGVGFWGFVWGDGVCSVELETTMMELDKKPEAVGQFYDEFPVGDGTDEDLYSDELNKTRLFCIRDREIIDATRQALFPRSPACVVPNGSTDTPLRRWIELLGNLAYLTTTRVPGASKTSLWAELEKAGSQKKYRRAPEKKDALDALDRAGLLTCLELDT